MPSDWSATGRARQTQRDGEQQWDGDFQTIERQTDARMIETDRYQQRWMTAYRDDGDWTDTGRPGDRDRYREMETLEADIRAMDFQTDTGRWRQTDTGRWRQRQIQGNVEYTLKRQTGRWRQRQISGKWSSDKDRQGDGDRDRSQGWWIDRQIQSQMDLRDSDLARRSEPKTDTERWRHWDRVQGDGDRKDRLMRRWRLERQMYKGEQFVSISQHISDDVIPLRRWRVHSLPLQHHPSAAASRSSTKHTLPSDSPPLPSPWISFWINYVYTKTCHFFIA